MSSATYKSISSILNVVQTIIALALAGASIWYFMELKGVTDLRNQDKYLLDFDVHWPQVLPWVFIFISLIVICVNVCGVYSACSKRKSPVYVYATFLSVVTLTAFTAGIIGLTCANSDRTDAFITETIKDAFDQIKLKIGASDAFQIIERRYRCCGIKDYSDYTLMGVPDSCCDNAGLLNCDTSARLRYGCAKVTVSYTQMFIKHSSIGSLAIGLIGMFCLAVVVLLVRRSRSDRTDSLKSEAESEPLKLPL